MTRAFNRGREGGRDALPRGGLQGTADSLRSVSGCCPGVVLPYVGLLLLFALPLGVGGRELLGGRDGLSPLRLRAAHRDGPEAPGSQRHEVPLVDVLHGYRKDGLLQTRGPRLCQWEAVQRLAGEGWETDYYISLGGCLPR